MDFSTLRVAKYFEAWLHGHVLNYRILTLYQLRCFGVKAHGPLNYSEVHVYLSPVETT